MNKSIQAVVTVGGWLVNPITKAVCLRSSTSFSSPKEGGSCRRVSHDSDSLTHHPEDHGSHLYQKCRTAKERKKKKKSRTCLFNESALWHKALSMMTQRPRGTRLLLFLDLVKNKQLHLRVGPEGNWQGLAGQILLGFLA